MNALRPVGALRPRRLKARNTAAAREAPVRTDAALPLARTDAPAPRPALPVPSVARAVVPLRDPPRVSVGVSTRCRPATSALLPFLSVYWRLCGAVRFRVLLP